MKTKNSIPTVIHLLSKDKGVPNEHRSFYDKIRHFHPDWDIRIYDDRDIKSFIKESFPEFMNAFDLFPHNIQRLDIARLLIVYKFGGFYMDMDMVCKKPLNDLLQHEIIFAVEKILTGHEMKLPHHRYEQRIANYMFGSHIGHPFLYSLAEHAIQNASSTICCENDILESTGPGMLTNFYHEKKAAYDNFFLLQNERNYCPKRCSLQPSCHFGDYAVHMHLGSWRWQ